MDPRKELRKLTAVQLDAFLVDEFRGVYDEVLVYRKRDEKISELISSVNDDELVLSKLDAWRMRHGLCRSRWNKVLFIMASTRDDVPMESIREAKVSQETLSHARYGRSFVTVEGTFLTADQLINSIDVQEPPVIVHVITHGGDAGAFVIRDESGARVIVPVGPFAERMRNAKHRPRLLVLNACNSAEHAEALAEHVDFVIGMKTRVTNRAAVEFAKALYRALGDGCNVQKAFDLAKLELALQGFSERDAPVLRWRRPGVDPASVYFVGDGR